jgi:hypothetical protein
VSRHKDIAIVCLALASGALAVLAWQQRTEIKRLSPAGISVERRPGTFTVHTGSSRSYAIAPRHAGIDTPRGWSRGALGRWMREVKTGRAARAVAGPARWSG